MLEEMMKHWQLLAVLGIAVGAGVFTLCQESPRCVFRRVLDNFVAKPSQTSEGEVMMPRSQAPESVVHVTESNFDQEVLRSEVPVLVDFYADWCGPCKMLAPVLNDVARETSDAKVVKVNVDHAPELAGRYGISGIPTLLVFNDGEVTAQQVGLASKNQIKAMLRR
jgi:thioredoxin 1